MSSAEGHGHGVVDIAYCPEHGLHGARDTCFECGKPVERITMIPLVTAARAWRALEHQRDRWMGHALEAGIRLSRIRSLLRSQSV